MTQVLSSAGISALQPASARAGARVPFAGVADYAGTKAVIAGYAKGVQRDLGMDLHAIRRMATLEEVAATVCVLAGPDAGYIADGVIDVAGGFQI